MFLLEPSVAHESRNHRLFMAVLLGIWLLEQRSLAVAAVFFVLEAVRVVEIETGCSHVPHVIVDALIDVECSFVFAPAINLADV